MVATPAASAQNTSAPPVQYDEGLPRPRASTDVPLEDSAYRAIERLAALGYIDGAFLGMRPWTRSECARLVEEAQDSLDGADEVPSDIRELVHALALEFAIELHTARARAVRVHSIYERTTAIAGTPITDSYHFGQTLTNDYGRPYSAGFNQVVGIDASSTLGRFAFRLRGEFQHAPSLAALNESARSAIGIADAVPEQPARATPAQDRVALLDATATVELGGFQITAGKQSLWWGPGRSGAMILSDNAEPIYMLRVSQTHPIQLPSILAYLGPMKVESFFGHLVGHRFPPSPFFYGQKITLKPARDFEFGFSRTVVFAGEGITPLTFGAFFHSFLSTSSGTAPGDSLRMNPGARHSAFDFSWRLPGLRRWGVVLYGDSVVHDDVSPVAAPRRAAINPGLYIARLPLARKFEIRAEAVSTDPPVSRSNGGKFIYWENIYRDAYTNRGNLLGSWIGRESKGGQAWVTYHKSTSTTLELSYRRAKLARDFIAGGGTQNDVGFSADWRLRSGVEARAAVQYEHWLIPAIGAAPRNDVVLEFELRWFNVRNW